MRLIDADALKVQVDKADEEWIEQDGLSGLNLVQQGLLLTLMMAARNDFHGEIDKAPTAQTWVPCGERLPEEDGEYIITFISNSGSRCTTTAKYLSDIKRWCVFYGHVSAWMEKPEPWKGGEK